MRERVSRWMLGKWYLMISKGKGNMNEWSGNRIHFKTSITASLIKPTPGISAQKEWTTSHPENILVLEGNKAVWDATCWNHEVGFYILTILCSESKHLCKSCGRLWVKGGRAVVQSQSSPFIQSVLGQDTEPQNVPSRTVKKSGRLCNSLLILIPKKKRKANKNIQDKNTCW